jgi:hypothetical protein
VCFAGAKVLKYWISRRMHRTSEVTFGSEIGATANEVRGERKHHSAFEPAAHLLYPAIISSRQRVVNLDESG